MKIKNVLKNSNLSIILKYSSIKYLVLFIGFFKGIINAKALGPESLGIVGSLFLMLSYLSYSNLGILYSMNREYVLCDTEERSFNSSKEIILYNSFTFLLVISFIMGVGGIAIIFNFKNELFNYYLLIILIAIFEQFRSYYITYFRLKNDFTKINVIELINNVLSLVLILVFISSFKIYAVLFAMLISNIIIFIYGFKNSDKIKLKLNFIILKKLIRLGIPLLLYNLGFYILTTVDRVMIVKFLTNKDLGYYTFSNQFVGGTLVFLSSILFLYYPKALRDLNMKHKTTANLLLRIKEYTKYTEILGVILCILGVLLIHPFVMLIMPEYYFSINIYRILTFATIANQLAYFANIFIVSNNKYKILIKIQLIITIMSIILNVLFLKIGFGIIGIAIATLFANFIYSILQHCYFAKINQLNIFSYIKGIYMRFLSFTFIIVVISFLKLNFSLYFLVVTSITMLLYYKDIKMILKRIMNKQDEDFFLND